MSWLGRWFPLDLLVVIAATGAAYAVTWLGAGAPVRVAVTLSYLLFVPGYALSTAVFPARRHVADADGVARGRRTAVAALDDRERLAVSFGLSLALLPLFGLSLAALQWGFAPRAVLTLTTLFVGSAMVIGVFRRAGLTRDVRYVPPVERWRREATDALFRTPMADRALNVALAVAVVAAVVALGVGLVAPQDGTSYTSLSLLTRSDDGQLVAADYPTEFSSGQGQRLVVEVANHEGEPVHYVLVVQLQRVEGGQVTGVEELDRFDKRVPPAGTWQVRHDVTPTMTGEDLRLVYLLYRGSAPGDPTVQNAYRHVSIWIDVS